ncbi:hypothetical protein [Streptomyces sp. A30]|uniref:hypothetical protein n=1 Tax=Streptomyces sp. A30 TaxID=2789273 RepID=UPI003980FC97
MDYLNSAVLYLSGGVGEVFDALGQSRAQRTIMDLLTVPDHTINDRDLKYAVLHLQAATEVLLKARLVREHWSLVFKDPGKATRSAFEQGKFESCGMGATLDRLVSIAGVPITGKQRETITDLAETRNALTHYGHTANAYAVEARAARVLDFLLDFVPLHLHPVLTSEASLVESTMAVVRNRLNDIEVLVKKRMQGVSGELAGLEDRTMVCPRCKQWALVIGGGDPVICRFCLETFAPIDVVIYTWNRDGDDLGIVDCPACGTAEVVILVKTAVNKTEDVALCMHCATVYEPPRRVGEA